MCLCLQKVAVQMELRNLHILQSTDYLYVLAEQLRHPLPSFLTRADCHSGPCGSLPIHNLIGVTVETAYGGGSSEGWETCQLRECLNTSLSFCGARQVCWEHFSLWRGTQEWLFSLNVSSWTAAESACISWGREKGAFLPNSFLCF